MESFRLKNIIILILALMNLCLLGLLGVRLTTGYSAQAEARQQMVQLFAADAVFSVIGDLKSHILQFPFQGTGAHVGPGTVALFFYGTEK